MTRRLLISIVLGLAMAVTSALTGALTPKPRAPLPHERFSLEQMIPVRFGAWTIDPSVLPLQPDPEQQGVLEKIYDQTLSRAYVNYRGQRVMLAIAYGGDQSKSLQLHLPEVCYVAQGFDMIEDSDGLLATPYGQLPVKRLVARLHQRNEPITYWITIGDKATKAGIAQKLRRLAYGLSGEVPDGMLVRVSTIQGNQAAAWQVQDGFVAEMLQTMSPTDRAHLIGAMAAQANTAMASTDATTPAAAASAAANRSPNGAASLAAVRPAANTASAASADSSAAPLSPTRTAPPAASTPHH